MPVRRSETGNLNVEKVGHLLGSNATVPSVRKESSGNSRPSWMAVTCRGSRKASEPRGYRTGLTVNLYT